jgi:hypothetical protein
VSAAEVLPVAGAVCCADCERMRRHADTLGRLRFELQHRVNVLDCRLRAAEARVVELEGELRRRQLELRSTEGPAWSPR